MSARRFGLSFSVGWFVIGCGASPSVEPVAPTKPLEEPIQVVEEAPDLSPVARPAELVGTLRIERPRLLFESLASWAGMPLRLEDALPEMARPLAAVARWDAPIQGLLALDSHSERAVSPPAFVLSVGIKSLTEALEAADRQHLPTRKLGPGIFRVGDSSDASCTLAPSLGAAPARLVCGRSPADVAALLPYATRGLAGEPARAANDLEVVLDAAAVQARYGQQVSALRLLAGMAIREVALDSPRFDRALSDVVYGAADEAVALFGDLDRIQIDARLDSTQSRLRVGGEYRLKGERSWTAGTLATYEAALPPATPPRLPLGTVAASYTVAGPTERVLPVVRALGELLDAYLEHEKFSPASRKRLRQLIEAEGVSPSSFYFGAPVPGATKDGGFFGGTVHVARIQEAPARLRGVLANLAGTLGDPAVKKWAVSRSSMDPKAWPKVTTKPLKVAGFKEGGVVYEVSVPVGLLETAMQWRGAATAEAGTGTARVEKLVLALQPDGDATLILAGSDLESIKLMLAETRKAVPGAVFTVPDPNQKASSAGFTTLASIVRSIAGRLPQGPAKVLATLPNHGETPLPFVSKVTPSSARLEAELPASFFADVTAFGMQAPDLFRAALAEAL